jgi:CheY-like chemotaxis protein
MTTRPKKILLVEDDLLSGEMLAEVLGRFGYVVERVGNGLDALRCYDPQTVDLVLTDLFMPEMDGLELIAALQRRDPGVRIIAMSGGPQLRPGAILPMAERLGAVKTLAKPIELAELRRAVVECLEAD